MEENAVKQICSELGITQKELAEKIGAAEATVRNWSAGKEVPLWAIKSFELLKKNKENQEIVSTVQKLVSLLTRDINK